MKTRASTQRGPIRGASGGERGLLRQPAAALRDRRRHGRRPGGRGRLGARGGALEESDATGGGEARVVELIQEANRRVHERATTDAETSGMGTTMTVALVENDGTSTFGHVGDSRAYLLRDGDLEQLTDDHSLVAELVRRGELSPEEAEVHPQRSVITRALGTDPDVDVDAFSVDARGRRRLPALLRRALDDGRRRHDRGDHRAASRRPRRRGTALIQAANRARRRRQHHRGPLRAGRGRRRTREPDERTREYVAPPDDEDTLHPGGRIAASAARAATARAGDTMVVPRRISGGDRELQSREPRRQALGRRLLALARDRGR